MKAERENLKERIGSSSCTTRRRDGDSLLPWGCTFPQFSHVPSHLYQGLLTKVRWFVLRFGWSEVFLKPIRSISAPFVLPWLKREGFQWQGRTLDGFYHRYNMTWAGERIVEIPIARTFLAAVDPRRVLEVGNVLSHYDSVSHRIVDKFESGEGVVNCDIVDFKSQEGYDLILSVSTFEHIGFDDDAAVPSGEKIQAAVRHCQGLLSDSGRLVLTVPLGYNPDLDRLIVLGTVAATRQSFLVRRGFSRWEECDLQTALAHPYRHLFPYANSIGILEFGKDPNPR